MKNIKTLTKAEAEIMKVLWKIDQGFLKDIMEEIPEPKPHSNTISTLLKILIEKKFVSAETIGRMNLYKPMISKDKYSGNSFSNMVKNYFEGSFPKAVSFLVEEKKLSLEDLELLIKQIKKK